MEKLKKYLDSTGIVFVLSMVAYLVAYCFELGYLRWFGINYQSVHVQTESFVISFILTVPAVIQGHYFFRAFKDLRRQVLTSRLAKTKIGGYVLRRLFSYALLLAFCYWLLVAFIMHFPWWACVAGLVLFLILEFTGMWAASPSSNVFSPKTDRAIGLIAIVSVFVIIGSIVLGMLYARTRTTYKVTTINGIQYIVVREYSTNFILRGVDKNGHLSPYVRFLPREQLWNYDFSQKEFPKIKG